VKITMNLLWKSDLSRSLTNSLDFLSSVPRAWFLKTTSSSHRRLTLKSWFRAEFNRGFPTAMSYSRSFCSSAAFSAS
jgi:hypothetical protein